MGIKFSDDGRVDGNVFESLPIMRYDYFVYVQPIDVCGATYCILCCGVVTGGIVCDVDRGIYVTN